MLFCLSLPDADIGNTQRASLFCGSLNTYSTSIAVPGGRLVIGIGKELETGNSGTCPPCAVVIAVGVVQETDTGISLFVDVTEIPAVGQFCTWMGWIPIKKYGIQCLLSNLSRYQKKFMEDFR